MIGSFDNAFNAVDNLPLPSARDPIVVEFGTLN
jgi:hypothetical protein